MIAVWPTLIAVAGTLGAGVLANLLQARSARIERREARRSDALTAAVNAVTALVSALADHRRAMWWLEHCRLSDADAAVVEEALATSHVTRSAVTEPLTRISILVPVLAPRAKEAERAAYALRNASTLDTLEARRAVAAAASDRLVDAAGALFARISLIEVA